ncbi:MAG TPA: hypothetical protein ENK94_03795 [Campylobacterales bacterium]|nr:hypothetical protein [Campylobacterales bacterium]
MFILRPSGRQPFNRENEFKFIFKKILYFLLSFIVLISITNFILTYKMDNFFYLDTLNISFHFSVIWLFLPFLFSFLLNHYFIDLPYKLFLKIHTTTFSKVNLFTSTKQLQEHHTKDEIYIDIIPQTSTKTLNESAKKEFMKIQNMYLRLIKFWYVQKHYTFKLRYYFPLLISFSSLLYFFYILSFTHCLQQNANGIIDGIQTMGLIAITLSILYFTMSSHINNFLHSDFYTNAILKELNKIYFDRHDHRQQLKLFFDKNFLVYIHDKQHDNHFCINDNKDFQNFIFNKKGDEEGRNLIIMVYISFFMILFIETSTGDLLGLDSNSTKPEMCIKIEENHNGKSAP